MSAAEEQVGLVVSVNYDKLKEMYDFWEKHNGQAQKDNKSTFEQLSESAGKFVRTGFAAAAGAAIGDFARTITAPINTTLSGATEGFKKFREDNTRIAVATGQDWKQVGERLKDLGKQTGRSQDELKSYASGVEQVTKRWDTAFDAAEAYSKLAHKTGRDMGSYGGLAGTMENLFKMKGSKETEDFFDRLISKAKALGLNANQAVSMFEKLAPSLGRGGASAEKAGEFSNAMLKAGASPEQAQEMGGFFSNYFKSGTRWVEREMRSAGQLKKGEKITDKWGRINMPIDELIGKYYRTQKKIRRGMSNDMFREIAIENMGNEAGSMFANWPEIEKQIAAQRQAEGGGALQKAGAGYKYSDAGERKGKDVDKELADLGLGAHVAPLQDALAGHGGAAGAAMNYGKLGLGAATAATFSKMAWNAVTGGGKAAGAAASTASKASMFGRALGVAGRFANWASILSMRGDNAVDPEEQAKYSPTAWAQSNSARQALGPVGDWLYSGLPTTAPVSGRIDSAAAPVSGDQRAQGQEQAKATADKIAEKVLRVQIVGLLGSFANAAGPAS